MRDLLKVCWEAPSDQLLWLSPLSCHGIPQIFPQPTILHMSSALIVRQYKTDNSTVTLENSQNSWPVCSGTKVATASWQAGPGLPHNNAIRSRGPYHLHLHCMEDGLNYHWVANTDKIYSKGLSYQRSEVQYYVSERFSKCFSRVKYLYMDK